ncbi:MAG: SRPBCC family protein [Actinomycetes bacterium]
MGEFVDRSIGEVVRSISGSRPIAASPETVWALVSDLRRMAELSPENTGGTWIKGSTGPALGARFKGTNAQGSRTWSTHAMVTSCEPGVSFAFRVSALGFAIARWAYDIVPSESGCVVTETWLDDRGRTMRVVGRMVSGIGDRSVHAKQEIERTLEKLAATAESVA